MRAFEAADKTNPPPKNAIEFIGSSSIKRWMTLAADFAGHKVFNCGFGGSHLCDSLAFADRIVIPYQPKLVVLYAGDNDIASGKSPEQIFADFKAFVAKVHAALPGTTIVFLAIKPSPSRAKYVEQARAGNRLIEEFIAGKPKLAYVDVFTPMLGSDGQPRTELFVSDRLHLNEAGYKLWTDILKPVLDKLDPPASAKR
jgi:lysophospholipase L1-like esterase